MTAAHLVMGPKMKSKMNTINKIPDPIIVSAVKKMLSKIKKNHYPTNPKNNSTCFKDKKSKKLLMEFIYQKWMLSISSFDKFLLKI